MKRLLLASWVFLAVFSTAFGQEKTYRKSFSLEVGLSQGPMHMTIRGVSPSRDLEDDLAKLGQEADDHDHIHPSLTLSGVLRTGYRWETVLTGCVSWSHCRIIQYETFGTDPEGNARYDLSKGSQVGWADVSPVWSLTLQGRVFWNPEWKVQMYSAFGIGLSGATDVLPLPSVMPVGCRLHGKHAYFFTEAGLSPFASFLHGGLGWKF